VPTSPHIRLDLATIPGYRAGRRATATDGAVAYSLASNESMEGPLPGVLAAATDVLAQSHLYPDAGVWALANGLANLFSVEPDWIATGTGSVAICQQAVVATCNPGDEVVYAWRSFEAYPMIAKLAGARPVPIPLRPDGTHDLSRMAGAITDRTRVVFLCSPNNPTGPVISSEELAGFLDVVPPSVLVMLDEAYYEYAVATVADAGDFVDGVALAKKHINVMALRTFSKAYGLAGLRVGYGIANPALTAALRKAALPFGVSAVAQAAALASLQAQDDMRARVAATVAERDRVTVLASAAGWPIPAAFGNYYWLPLGERALEFAASCEEVGITVRAFPDEGVRVTIGEGAANDRVLDVLLTQFSI
jgi:histidinol-phosphate aminotransferase